MTEMSDFDRFLQKQLDEDPEFRHEWERSEPLYSVIGEVIHQRIVQNLTQADLAARMGKKQPAIARFEAGNAENPTLGFLQDIAEALGMKLVVRLEPKDVEYAITETATAQLAAETRESYTAS